MKRRIKKKEITSLKENRHVKVDLVGKNIWNKWKIIFLQWTWRIGAPWNSASSGLAITISRSRSRAINRRRVEDSSRVEKFPIPNQDYRVGAGHVSREMQSPGIFLKAWRHTTKIKHRKTIKKLSLACQRKSRSRPRSRQVERCPQLKEWIPSSIYILAAV